jgi:dihydroorotase
MWVVPGLVDMHVHLREPGAEHKETIASGVAAAAAGGFTTIAAMPNTSPCSDNCDTIDFVVKKAAALESTAVIPSCAITAGRQGKELVDMNGISKKCGVTLFTDDGDGVEDDEIMREALFKVKELGGIISQHSEYASISHKAPVHQGEVSRSLNIKGQPVESEYRMVIRDIQLVRETGGRLHVSHISSATAISAVREAKKEGLPVTAEVTPHHLHLVDEDITAFGTMAKVAPPLRPAFHVNACREALADGTIDVVATDHAPHTFEDKAGTMESAAFGMSGLEISVPMMLKLVEQKVITPVRMVEVMSKAPAALLGVKGGDLNAGSIADITVINPDAPFEIDPSSFVSKGRNTPFAGTIAPGRTLFTIKNGKIIFELS